MKITNLFKTNYFFYFLILISSTLVFITQKNIFFWDTIQLASEQATWFYTHHFNSIFLPTSIDSGHIPSFGLYLAAIWLFFKKSLLVSHLSILPFVWLTVFFEWKIAGIYYSGIKRKLLSLLLFLEPSLLAQFTLVSPDIILVAFFLMHSWAILSRHKKWRIISALFLVLISLRGVIVLSALELFLLISSKPKKYLSQEFIYLFPAIILWLLYQYFHFRHSGWIGWHSNSPWEKSFEWVNLKQFMRNSLIFAWRIFDFGRFSLYTVLIILFIKNRKIILSFPEIKELSLLISLLGILFYIITVPHLHLTAHRYFIPIYLITSIITFICIEKYILSIRIKVIAFLFIFINLIAGHFWIYPDRIAQGWDSSLAYLPYIKIQTKLENYIHKHQIHKESIGSDFPNLAQTKYLDLSSDTTHYKPFDMKSDSLILYSNIFNNFTENEIETLSHWKIIKSFSKDRIKVILYKKK